MFPVLACGCNDHADVCEYSSSVEYGVCQGCRDFTAGDKCDQCVEFYRINPDKDLYNATNPVPPGCTGTGNNVIYKQMKYYILFSN